MNAIDYTELSNEYAPYRIFDANGDEWGDGPYDKVADACDDADLFACGAAIDADEPDSALTVYGRRSGRLIKIVTFTPEWLEIAPKVVTTEADDDDPYCVCGVARSEHALCGCGEWETAS